MNYSSFTHIFVDHESLLDRFSVQMLSSPGGWLDMVQPLVVYDRWASWLYDVITSTKSWVSLS